MTDRVTRPAFLRTLTVSVFSVLAIFAALILAEETGFIGSDPARRGVSALMGVLLLLCGNYLPKLTAAPSPNSARLAKADRAAGRLLILTGLGFALIWVLAPLDWARAVSPMAGLAGGLIALLAWVFVAQRAEGGSAGLAASALSTAARLGVLMISGSIIATFGLFEIDRRWGDEAAQWTSIIFVLSLGFIGASSVVRAVIRRG